MPGTILFCKRGTNLTEVRLGYVNYDGIYYMIVFFFQKYDITLRFTLSGSLDNTDH